MLLIIINANTDVVLVLRILFSEYAEEVKWLGIFEVITNWRHCRLTEYAFATLLM